MKTLTEAMQDLTEKNYLIDLFSEINKLCFLPFDQYWYIRIKLHFLIELAMLV